MKNLNSILIVKCFTCPKILAEVENLLPLASPFRTLPRTLGIRQKRARAMTLSYMLTDVDLFSESDIFTNGGPGAAPHERTCTGPDSSAADAGDRRGGPPAEHQPLRPTGRGGIQDQHESHSRASLRSIDRPGTR